MVTVRQFDADSPIVASSPLPVRSSRPSNRAVAGLVVAVMLVMATIALTFALKTVGVRRANDTKGAVPPEPALDSRPLPPAEWPGLGYLPNDVQAVAGVRLADAMESAAGRALLGPLSLGGATMLLGVTPGDVDHLIIGANARALPPRLTAVIHGRLRSAAGTGGTTDQHGKALLRGRLWANGPEGTIWRADPQTLIAAQLPEDFDKISAKPRPTGPLPELMERLDPAALVWLVASVDADNPAVGFAAGFLPPATRDALAKLAAVAVSIRIDGPKMTLTVHVRGQDADSGWLIAKALADILKQPAAEVTVHRQSGDWCRVTATGNADKLADWFRPK
jgi:hypothetical protein